MTRKTPDKPLGFLVTRYGHSIPLSSLSPQSIQTGCQGRYVNRNEKFNYQKALYAVVNLLGFDGGWDAYQNKHFPQIGRFLTTHNCQQQGGLFPGHHGGCIDLWLTERYIKARDLSDRLFLSGRPWPERVFLGHGVDWSVWDRGDGHTPPQSAINTIGGDPSTAAERARILWQYRIEMMEDWTFLRDALFGQSDASDIGCLFPSNDQDDDKKLHYMERATLRRKAFLDVFGSQPEGWVEIIKVTDALAILKGCDGTWQPLWKGFRDTAPPDGNGSGINRHLGVRDRPSLLVDGNKVERCLYERREVWDEFEDHKARKRFLDLGNSLDILHRTSDLAVRAEYLKDIGDLPKNKLPLQSCDLPPGFTVMPPVNGERFALGDPITVAQFNSMLQQSDYLARRSPEADDLQWYRGNGIADDSLPACVCWVDAQAYCRWFEDRHHVAVRLPAFSELVAVRPCQSYESMQRINGGNAGTHPTIHGFGKKLMWQGDRAQWQPNSASTQYQGALFFDSDDLYEFCHEPGKIVGRFLELGAPLDSDGRYKHIQVMFRLAIPLVDSALEVTHG